MEPEIILDAEAQTANGKIYKDTHFAGALFLGGPLAGGYIMAENYKVLGEPDKARNAWIVSIVATVIVSGISFLLSSVSSGAGIGLPLVYILVGSRWMKQLQGEKIATFIANGGQTYSVGRTIGISIISLLVTFAVLVAIDFLNGYLKDNF